MPLNQTSNITNALVEAYGIATGKRHEFLTPEHLLAGYLKDRDFWDILSENGRSQELEDSLYNYLNSIDSTPEGQELTIEFSSQLQELFETAAQTAAAAMTDTLQTHHLIYGIFQLEDSNARYHLERCLDSQIPDFLNSLIGLEESESGGQFSAAEDKWLKYFNEVEPLNNLIGRKKEMAQVMQVLCRRSRNNVLLAGGRGVGKRAIARAVAASLELGNVPDKLKGHEILEFNAGMMLSGTQYRGDLEERVQSVMKAIADESRYILYISDLRSLGGTSRTDDSSKDILSLLIPYFKSENVRFIISATPEELKKLNSSETGIASLLRQIDIEEPSDKENEKIIKTILPALSECHGVSYENKTISQAISLGRRYIQDRCLPDKALDLLDEAGAYAETRKEKKVTTSTVTKALADICRIDSLASEQEEEGNLYHLEEKLSENIYGQSKAIKDVAEAILMSKAGLTDSGKAIGSFLFVGPTGVGKTELSKVLAHQLHVPLHRFDMSEYSEKHSVAKLIGSPAGYVGYDDGGILTDTIRRNPYCVLLLDEIEKAHEDIYNLLLQVMDYAVITDNKGRKVDFRNVVLIMTSNAGARYAHKSVGFERKGNAGAVMAKEVKNIFAPEFINRLTSVVVFNDMDEKMASLILDRKISLLQDRLNSRKIRLEIAPEAYARLLKEGFSPEYGAREIERVLNSRINPLLMREILFGKKEGFTAHISLDEDNFIISNV